MHGLIGWDNKGTVQHMAKMSYMTERADRLEGLAVRSEASSLSTLLVANTPSTPPWGGSVFSDPTPEGSVDAAMRKKTAMLYIGDAIHQSYNTSNLLVGLIIQHLSPWCRFSSYQSVHV